MTETINTSTSTGKPCSSVVEAIDRLHRRMTATLYRYEFDTEDVVLGFKTTKKGYTRLLHRALAIERKLRNDLGTFISPSVRIVAIRLYRNNELRGEFKI